MQPVSSNTKPDNKCLNPVTTKCVTWDGPEITCLDGTVLCKGQTIENSIYLLASKLCLIYEAIGIEGVNTCINNIQDGTSVSIGATSTLQEIFSAIISKVCTLNTRVETLENTDCPEIRAVVPNCILDDTTLTGNLDPRGLQGWDAATNTLPIEVYANYVARLICSILFRISSIQNDINQINQDLETAWDLLNNCSENCSFSVQPTCTNNSTLNPSGGPVFISDAYNYLESSFCQLQSSVGSSQDITDAILKQCPDLDNQDKLSTGGIMSNTPGWVTAPNTLSESLTNMWLTVCDMRAAVQQILDGCCFSLCSYLQLGYNITWAGDGSSISISFNSTGLETQFTSPSIPAPPTSPWIAGTTVPAWVTAQFPVASQTNVVLTFSDGAQPTPFIATFIPGGGLTIYDLCIATTPFTFPFPVGYDTTSNNQTININFDYEVDPGGAVTPVTCTIDQTDAMPFVCCAPAPAPYEWAYDVTSSDGTDLTVIVRGIEETTPAPLYTGTITAVGLNTITDGTGPFAPAILCSTGVFGYIVEITSGPATGTFKYVTSATATQLTVNSNWAVSPTPGDTYQVQNIYWQFPLVGPAYPCNAVGTSPLQSLTLQIVEIDANYDPNDSSTWNSALTINNLTPAALLAGVLAPPGTVNPNTNYVVYVNGVYACDVSDYTPYSVLTPISVAIAVAFGTSTNPAPLAFSSTGTTVPVTNIISNGVSLPAISPATSSAPASFALNLPAGLNVTRFEFEPSPAVWSTTPGATRQYAICGTTYSPLGTSGPNNTPNRDYIYGLYRGYNISVNTITSTGTEVPYLDPCGTPYTTSSLNDPNALFINNIPTTPWPGSFTCPFTPCPPAPPVPTSPACTAGSPITIDIPSTFASNSVPIVVRYNPAFPVNTAPDFHTITVPAGSQISYSNLTGVPVNVQWYYAIRVMQWDAGTNQYVDYSPIRVMNLGQVTAGICGPGTSTYTVPSPQTLQAKYSDALFVTVAATRFGLGPTFIIRADGTFGTNPTRISPLATSQFSCNVPTLTEFVGSIGGPGVSLSGLGPNLYGNTWSCIITEDYNITFDTEVGQS